MSNNSEYKPTLNLPKTDFPMKADLPKREPLMLEDWAKKDLYGLIRRKPDAKGRYILHDGPPYANGDIHIGHALNKTLKDIVIKYKTMQGYDCPYVPGWDCHGLPIEHQLFKELKIAKHQIPQLEFRKKAHDYAMKYVANQREQFKRLGVFGEWDNPYLTLSPEYEEAIISSFNNLYKQGFIKRGLKPVNWCFKCETALAEAEVEYEDHISPSVFVKFAIQEDQGWLKDSYLVIWTTTPWTLIANVAVALHPEFSYSYIKTAKGNLIIADVRLSVLPQMGIEQYEVIKNLKGKDLAGTLYGHPFGLRSGKVVLADYVSAEEGTGLVHTAPGHGAEDYQTGLKYGLEIVMPVDPRGKFDPSAGEFAGQNVYDANFGIIKKLDSIGALLLEQKISHSYPHCWRCKHPIIFRATKQWFLMIDHQGLRHKVLEAIKNEVTWIPPAGRDRISAMVQLRPDWCLSRQRYWGVPVPALVCQECHEEFFVPEVIERFAKLSAQEGSDCWFSRSINDFIPQGLVCPECKQGKSFTKGTDILDVWFDSGVSSQAVLKKRKELGGVPAQLYLEGSDQHRGWFQSSIIPGLAIDGKPPFVNVLTHGFVVDGEGKKMSKSQGNVISPAQIIKDYGADILRMWVASSDYNEDIRISKEILSRLSEAYRKIRNTAKFILSNLYDFNPDTDKVPYEKLRKIDQWILYRMESVRADVEIAYGTEQNPLFEFHRAYKRIYDFCNEELSMYYLDMVKGRLYTYAARSVERRAAQTVIYEVLNRLIRLMAPILVFTAEEIWQNIPKEKKDADCASVHLLDFPPASPVFRQDELQSRGLTNIDQQLKELIGLVPLAAKALEELRSKGIIGSSFDAQINILTNTQDRYTFLQSCIGELAEIFKVSLVEAVLDQDHPASLTVEAEKAQGTKCLRCWNYSPEVGKHPEHPLICNNCLKAIGE
ncbi:MAG: isoleucine--tRNA ligase [Candidatus Omnitrophica bacterium CG11_big_fil_rev_8_21_14_0_20_43_6]|nr:MAG: isoleucine--tRNA ligase [Candidatus Omnitrophica bacterium CG11_big_fil_rev_8_21_14_0_20_43_6]